MEKSGIKCRKIKFKSRKNNKVLLVHSKEEKKYAEFLEEVENISGYNTLVDLDMTIYNNISHIGIRKEYFETAWVSDFVLIFKNGLLGIREIVAEDKLFKKATIERLELSRRYWEYNGNSNWRIVVVGGSRNVLKDQ